MTYVRSAWQNQFNRPQIKTLRSGLRALDVKLFDRMRKKLAELDELTESVEWFGQPWHWSLTYRSNRTPEPVLVLIPSPLDLQAAMPLDRELAEELATRKLKRTIQDGLSLAREPFDTRWGVWFLIGASVVDDLQSVADLKIEHLKAKVAG